VLQYFIGRQAIFNSSLNVIGYELLYRPHDTSFVDKIDDGDAATSQVLLNSFMEIGLNELVGSHKAFFNLTRNFIINSDLIPPVNDQLVLEILEDIEVDDELIQAVKTLKKKGYTIALDDFIYHEKMQPLVELADIIKIDLLAISKDELYHCVNTLQKYPLKLLAEKVETHEDFNICKDLGFDYYQGFFLCRPKTLKGTRIPGNRLAALQMIASLQDPNVEVPELEKIISQDISLTFKLIKYINSAAFSLGKKIESIRHAIIYLGINEVKNWASLIAMSNANDKPGELFVTSLTRAKMCEILMESIDPNKKGGAFITGMFSTLDAIMDSNMSDLLAEMPVATEIKDALLEKKGIYGEILQGTLAYERGDWDMINYPEIDKGTFSDSYMQAVRWATQAGNMLVESTSKAA